MFKSLTFQILYTKYSPKAVRQAFLETQKDFLQYVSGGELPETYPARGFLNATMDVLYHAGIEEQIGTGTPFTEMS